MYGVHLKMYGVHFQEMYGVHYKNVRKWATEMFGRSSDQQVYRHAPQWREGAVGQKNQINDGWPTTSAFAYKRRSSTLP